MLYAWIKSKTVCQLNFNFKKSENSKVGLDYFKNY